jgi:hypothetical protein
VDDLGALHQVDQRLLPAAQVGVGEEGLRAPALDGAHLLSPDLARNHRVVVPVRVGPAVVAALDLAQGAEFRQRMMGALEISAAPVVGPFVPAAIGVLGRREGRPDVPRSHPDGDVEVEALVEGQQVAAPQVPHQLVAGLSSRPVVHGNAVRRLSMEDGQPALARCHGLLGHRRAAGAARPPRSLLLSRRRPRAPDPRAAGGDRNSATPRVAPP